MSRDAHPSSTVLGVWERFDTLWYIQIAHTGYAEQGRPFSIRFIRRSFAPSRDHRLGPRRRPRDLNRCVFLPVLGRPSAFSAWITCRGQASKAILLWAIWPASFTFFGGYPDSLLCAAIVWSLYFARAGRWHSAGALGLCRGTHQSPRRLPRPSAAVDRLGTAAKRADSPPLFCPATARRLPGFPRAVPLSGRRAVHKTTGRPRPSHPEDPARSRDLRQPRISPAADPEPVGLRYRWDGGPDAVRAPPNTKLLTVAAMCLFLTKHTQPLLQSTMRYSLTIFAAFPSLSSRRGPPLAFLATIRGLENWLAGTLAAKCPSEPMQRSFGPPLGHAVYL